MFEREPEGIVTNRDSPSEERIRWEHLVEVRIVTTDEGPLLEDVFWLLLDANEKGIVIPGADIAPLLSTLQKLPRFDNEAVIRAAASTDNASFVAWRGNPGEATILRDVVIP